MNFLNMPYSAFLTINADILGATTSGATSGRMSQTFVMKKVECTTPAY